MSLFLDITKQFHQACEDNGATDERLFWAIIDTLSEEESAEYDRGADLFDELSNNAPPTIENLERFDRQIDELLAS